MRTTKVCFVEDLEPSTYMMHLKDGDTAADHELGMLSVEKSGKSIVLIMSQKSGHVPVGTS